MERWARTENERPYDSFGRNGTQLERGGSGWLDSFTHSLSGASRVVDYAAVRRVVRFS